MNVVPASYKRGATFGEWAHDRTMEGLTLRSQLMAEREVLLEQIDWASWNSEQSRRLALLDYLLSI